MNEAENNQTEQNHWFSISMIKTAKTVKKTKTFVGVFLYLNYC